MPSHSSTSELERLALYDPLTGLPNRAIFTDRLGHALGRRAKTSVTAVYFVDLDRFKRINDSLGHAAGDEVLREVSKRFAAKLAGGAFISRIGGDEFTVVLADVGQRSFGVDLGVTLGFEVRADLILTEVFGYTDGKGHGQARIAGQSGSRGEACNDACGRIASHRLRAAPSGRPRRPSSARRPRRHPGRGSR